MAEEQVKTAVAAPKSSKNETQYSKAGKMVMDAISNLNERKGSSFMKIRNYMTAQNPEIDMTRYSKLVKKFILASLEKGDLKTNDETKGIRGFFRIAPEVKKKNNKANKSTSSDKSSASQKKSSKTVSSPKVKKPVSKTVKLPSAVVATTIKKKKTKASSADAEKEQGTKSKKKTATGTKRTKKTEDEASVPKKRAKKTESEAPKPKAKARPKKAKAVVQQDDEIETANNDVESDGGKETETEEPDTVKKVARGKGKKKAAAEKVVADKPEKVVAEKPEKVVAEKPEKPKKSAASKKKKAASVDDDSKEE